ncbi:MAG TPA: hypothetical protein VEJ87_03645 [Acidimicrobiales bacterium]|nr:hypothetical protein [Acidimicrobiales bacterium]
MADEGRSEREAKERGAGEREANEPGNSTGSAGETSWNPPGVDDGFSPGPIVAGEPLPQPEESTPLEEDEPEGTIPPCPLWAMKERRHVQWSKLAGAPPARIREAFGDGDLRVYLIEDGHHHVIVGRKVGETGDGCQYALVGRAPKSLDDALREGQLSTGSAFEGAEELTLYGIDVDEQDKASDLFVVERFGKPAEIPRDYLPGQPILTFQEPLPVAGL